MWGFGNKKEEPFSKTKVKFLYSGPVGEYPGWK